jgi:DeoR/GlpR family transcriptional regulator of sugar metabolism
MFAQERHNAIKKIVREHRRLSFSDLQKIVKVSPATLRRDLTELEQAGEVIRVHGGVLDPGYVRSEISFDERVLRHGSAKKAIAAAVTALVPPGATVFVDAGSTCLEAGKVLLGRADLTIITHSVALLSIGLQSEAKLICIGGELRKVSGALVGGSALGALSSLRADIALIGATGMDMEGCFTTELSEAELKNAVAARSTRKILLADSSKWLNPSTVRFAQWNDFDDWVLETSLPQKELKQLRSSGVAVHSADQAE